MNFPKFAIENHQFTTIIIVLLIISGVVSLLIMPRSEDPLVTPPNVNIVAIYPGATPEDIEELVVDPIEEVINELDDIVELTSFSSNGLGVIGVEFTIDADLDDKYSQVVQNVNSIRDELPDGIISLELDKINITDVNILQLALRSETAPYRQLEREAELLKDQLDKLPGVKAVEIEAYPEQEIRVSINLEKLAQLGIPLMRVQNALASSAANIPGGSVDIGSRRFNIKTTGAYQSLDDIRRTIVHSVDGAVVYLDDVADIDFAYEDEKYHARVNGTRAVFVSVQQKNHTNVFGVMDGLKGRIGEFEPTLPDNIDLFTVFDQSVSVEKRVNSFFANLLQGLLLVGIVVFLAANYRSAIIVMLAIPFSILIAIGFVDLSGFGLQQMSIAGLVIALGLLVDNAIVVTENIGRFMRQGYPPIKAAIEGTSQIGWAIVSSTATTILAFLPLAMMQNVTGDFIRSMPVTVIYALAASLLISLSLTPFLSSRYLKITAASGDTPIRRRLDNLVSGPYKKTLDIALMRRWTVLGIASVIFLGSLTLFPVVGVSFFPKAEKPQFIINIDLPQGSNLDATDNVARYVEAVLDQRDDISHYATNIGHGNPRIYYNVIPKNESSTHAQLFVQLNKDNITVLENAINELRDEFEHFPGARITIREFEQGPPSVAPIAIRIIGESLNTLRDISRDVEAMYREVPGVINVDNPLSTTRTDLRVQINRDKAAMLAVPLIDIDRTVRTAVTGASTAQYRDDDGKEYDIVMRLPVEDKMTTEHFDQIYIASAIGEQIPLRQLASIEFEASPLRINHFNQNRNVIITADVATGISVNESTKQIIEKLKAYEWPKGYSYYISGELENQQESFGGMGRAVIIALIAIFAVLVLQFRSYSQPLIVFGAIPLAIIGSILALLITGYTFSFTAFIGVSSLVGIVINNSIILVDYTNQLRREGMDMGEALKEAGQARFIPIILTTLTTVGGLLPLTLGGGSMWAPMGWAIIGGLIVSTFLTLVVVPVLFSLFSTEKSGVAVPVNGAEAK